MTNMEERFGAKILFSQRGNCEEPGALGGYFFGASPNDTIIQ
jgi:hypothetical protein